MEIKKLLTRTRMFSLLCVVCLLIAGCGTKYWWEYEDAWVSTEPYINISTSGFSNKYYCEIEINEEIVATESAWANNGTGITFYKILDSGIGSPYEEDIIWETSVKIKNGKMYLTVEVDNYGDNEGKTFVLEQQASSEEE